MQSKTHTLTLSRTQIARRVGGEQTVTQHCPRCHLSIQARSPQIALDYCPRCIAQARRLVILSSPAQTA
ncbi:MAG TPA: hypothetical protein VGF15_06530 [Solirubrobacteraceae bacterium]